MTTSRKLPRRSASLHSKVLPEIFDAVQAFALAEGYTLSAAINRILSDWKKGSKRKRA